jgi:hypothetical protein
MTVYNMFFFEQMILAPLAMRDVTLSVQAIMPHQQVVNGPMAEEMKGD